MRPAPAAPDQPAQAFRITRAFASLATAVSPACSAQYAARSASYRPDNWRTARLVWLAAIHAAAASSAASTWVRILFTGPFGGFPGCSLSAFFIQPFCRQHARGGISFVYRRAANRRRAARCRKRRPADTPPPGRPPLPKQRGPSRIYARGLVKRLRVDGAGYRSSATQSTIWASRESVYWLLRCRWPISSMEPSRR